MMKNGFVENRQLSAGRLQATVNGFVTPNLVVSNFRQNKVIHQEGVSMPGYVTFLIWNGDSVFNWRSQKMTSNSIGIIENKEHHAVTGIGFEGFPISVKKEFMLKLLIEEGSVAFFEKLLAKEVITVDSLKLDRFKRYVKSLCVDVCKGKTNEVDEYSIVLSLLNCFENVEWKSRFENIKLKRALDIIEEQMFEEVPLRQVCAELGVSERTLRYQFQQQFEISPKTYRKALRLSNVYKALKLADKKESVKSIASAFGFWHLGQFAKDYYAMFGELPRETLSKFN
jgi:AraC-like DNA-binding protein